MAGIIPEKLIDIYCNTNCNCGYCVGCKVTEFVEWLNEQNEIETFCPVILPENEHVMREVSLEIGPMMIVTSVKWLQQMNEEKIVK